MVNGEWKNQFFPFTIYLFSLPVYMTGANFMRCSESGALVCGGMG